MLNCTQQGTEALGFASPFVPLVPRSTVALDSRLPLLLLFSGARRARGGLVLFYLFHSPKTSWSSASIFLAKYQRGELELVSALFNSHLFIAQNPINTLNQKTILLPLTSVLLSSSTISDATHTPLLVSYSSTSGVSKTYKFETL